MFDIKELHDSFVSRYGRTPRLFRAPGRVNLIGEHTDYNDGFVLPAAIDRATYVAASPRNDRLITAASVNFEGDITIDLDDRNALPRSDWGKYVQGVALTLESAGYELKGADLLIGSDIPLGAGLSSSAALEVSTVFALAALSRHEVDEMALAKVGQAAEHKYAGVLSGIMDQFASVFGRSGNALFLDCRSLEWRTVPLAEAKFIICNTKTSHDLAEGEYNKRRSECEAAAQLFGRSSLRDVTLSEVFQPPVGSPDVLVKRARHIVTENSRVTEAVSALEQGDLSAFGGLMNASHESLRDDFEVSCAELDTMVEIARRQRGVLGARMTGGGFGGCTINLVEPELQADFVRNVTDEYRCNTGIIPEIYDCAIADGVCEIKLGELLSN